MTKRIKEAATLRVDPTTKALRVCLISEGEGSSADYPREFFTQTNGDALAGALSYPNHPFDIDHPEQRDPLSAIGSIGDVVTIEEHDGRVGFWADYHPAQSKPEIAAYLHEYAHKLGLSVYADSTGRINESNGKWIAEGLDANDPYRSVDLVVAAGARGKFEKVSESLGLLPTTSATAGGKDEVLMDPETKKAYEALLERMEASVKVFEGLADRLTKDRDAIIAEAQVEVDTAAAEKIAEGRIADYDKVNGLLAEAKLTESQEADVRDLLKTGATIEQIETRITRDKKVLSEAFVAAGIPEGRTTDAHLGDGATKRTVESWTPTVPGFGQVN